MSLSFAFTFLISCAAACIFFTLGRSIEKIAMHSADRDKSVQNLLDESENIQEDQVIYDSPKNFNNEIIIDAEYEDVVLDLEKYRKRNEFDSTKDLDIDYEIMYYKKTNQYVKLPKEVADLIKFLKIRS